MKRVAFKPFPLAVFAVFLVLLGPLSVQAENTNTTIQEGRVNINRTLQYGDSNDNAAYQSGMININRTIQIGGDSRNETGQFGRYNRNETSQSRGLERAGYNQGGARYAWSRLHQLSNHQEPKHRGDRRR